jgi:hypothetical protein
LVLARESISKKVDRTTSEQLHLLGRYKETVNQLIKKVTLVLVSMNNIGTLVLTFKKLGLGRGETGN